ncbi:hypothetical protein [Neorhizobium sp. DAR64860/K0K1]|uniref:hypothetical protein n=1 Tax=Neorhizobium sp. DAR64860/K0K1 TaxID=3421955 RepID=UPI003D2A3DD4
MGGSSGGSISTLDLTKITSAANERIQQAFSRERKLLFVCGSSDTETLGDLISKTAALRGIEFEVLCDPSDAIDAKISDFNIVVSFVHSSTDHALINSVVQIAVAQKKTCLFVRHGDMSSVPQYVLQYRIRTFSWHDFIEFVRS